MNRIFYLFILICIGLAGCTSIEKTKIDKIVYADLVYACDSSFQSYEAIAINDGIIIDVGTTISLKEKYEALENIDATGNVIYPGLIDGHCHFYGYGKTANQLNLKQTDNFEDLLNQVKSYAISHPEGWVLGRGWDQNDWEEKTFPNKVKLDLLFPNRPVVLKRIDGHAALANQAALDQAGITVNSLFEGGKAEQKHGQLTGILIDNAVDVLTAAMPKPTRLQQIESLLKAQEDCFDVGLTCVADAGLDLEIIQLIDSLQQTGDLTIKVYAMMNPTAENFEYFLPKSDYKTGPLVVRSVKLYGDGSLGSRGALLKKPYCDDSLNMGFLLTDSSRIDSILNLMYVSNFQVNTHCIGDSANALLLSMYGHYLKGVNDRRWRIEHAQIVDPNDLHFFKNHSIIPSVQPTHATSDMYWAEDRICNDRMAGAYSYQDLLIQNGYLTLGTDFPVENIDPLLTFYAAVFRKDQKGYPDDGFKLSQGLTRKQAMLGMTNWAAKSQFMENQIGSIAIGKSADFVVLDRDLMALNFEDNVKVVATFINGQKK